jgi:hypothetical protein
MARQDILNQIADLNHQINQEEAAQRAPEFGGTNARFPTSTVLAALAVWAWGQFGDLITLVPGAARFHGLTAPYTNYVVIGLGGLVTVQVLRMLSRRKPKIDKNYAESAERVRLLQNERRLLQEKLKSLPE